MIKTVHEKRKVIMKKKIEFKKLIVPALLVLNLVGLCAVGYMLVQLRKEVHARDLYDFNRISRIERQLNIENPNIEDYDSYVKKAIKTGFSW